MFATHNTCVSYKNAKNNSDKSLDITAALVSYAINGLGLAQTGSARTRVLARNRQIGGSSHRQIVTW